MLVAFKTFVFDVPQYYYNVLGVKLFFFLNSAQQSSCVPSYWEFIFAFNTGQFPTIVSSYIASLPFLSVLLFWNF